MAQETAPRKYAMIRMPLHVGRVRGQLSGSHRRPQETGQGSAWEAARPRRMQPRQLCRPAVLVGQCSKCDFASNAQDKSGKGCTIEFLISERPGAAGTLGMVSRGRIEYVQPTQLHRGSVYASPADQQRGLPRNPRENWQRCLLPRLVSPFRAPSATEERQHSSCKCPDRADTER